MLFRQNDTFDKLKTIQGEGFLIMDKKTRITYKQPGNWPIFHCFLQKLVLFSTCLN